jgi:hypothetical protein
MVSGTVCDQYFLLMYSIIYFLSSYLEVDGIYGRPRPKRNILMMKIQKYALALENHLIGEDAQSHHE